MNIPEKRCGLVNKPYMWSTDQLPSSIINDVIRLKLIGLSVCSSCGCNNDPSPDVCFNQNNSIDHNYKMMICCVIIIIDFSHTLLIRRLFLFSSPPPEEKATRDAIKAHHLYMNFSYLYYRNAKRIIQNTPYKNSIVYEHLKRVRYSYIYIYH